MYSQLILSNFFSVIHPSFAYTRAHVFRPTTDVLIYIYRERELGTLSGIVTRWKHPDLAHPRFHDRLKIFWKNSTTYLLSPRFNTRQKCASKKDGRHLGSHSFTIRFERKISMLHVSRENILDSNRVVKGLTNYTIYKKKRKGMEWNFGKGEALCPERLGGWSLGSRNLGLDPGEFRGILESRGSYLEGIPVLGNRWPPRNFLLTAFLPQPPLSALARGVTRFTQRYANRSWWCGMLFSQISNFSNSSWSSTTNH